MGNIIACRTSNCFIEVNSPTFRSNADVRKSVWIKPDLIRFNDALCVIQQGEGGAWKSINISCKKLMKYIIAYRYFFQNKLWKHAIKILDVASSGKTSYRRAMCYPNFVRRTYLCETSVSCVKRGYTTSQSFSRRAWLLQRVSYLPVDRSENSSLSERRFRRRFWETRVVLLLARAGESRRTARGKRNGKKEEGKKESNPVPNRDGWRRQNRSLGPAVEGAKEDKEKGGGGPPYWQRLSSL